MQFPEPAASAADSVGSSTEQRRSAHPGTAAAERGWEPVQPRYSLLMHPFDKGLKIYARLRLMQLAREDVEASQRHVFRKLIAKGTRTKFGRDHDFAGIRTIEDFQARVPLRTHDEFWRDYWQPHFPRIENITWPGVYPFFARSSGTTTGVDKYIPTTHEQMHINSHGVGDLFVHHYNNVARDRVFFGKILMLGGSADLVEDAPGIFSGDMTGIEMREAPFYARPWVFPTPELSLISDWEEKVERLTRAALAEDIRAIIGLPNWLLVFFDRLLKLRPGAERLADVFPNLELVLHGGMNFAPYRQRFRELLSGRPAETREMYAASEGFFAVADRGDGEGMRLLTRSGIFYEFVPMAEFGSARPTRHWIGNIEPGIEYAIILTSCAGHWSYVIGDTVRFVDTRPPRLLVTGRTKYSLNTFGEHMIAEEVERSVGKAAELIGRDITEYSVGAVWPRPGEVVGAHRYLVEFAEPELRSEAVERFRSAIDENLIKINDDYLRRRTGGLGMREPEIVLIRPGGFSAWMKSRGKLGGQRKVPRLIADQALFESLQGFFKANGYWI